MARVSQPPERRRTPHVRPRALRAQSHRLPARGRSAHRALQLSARPGQQGRVRAADRGHRYRALDRRVHARDPRRASLAGAQVGRRAGRGRRVRALRADRAPRALRGRGAPARGFRARLPVLLHAGRARGAARAAARARRGPALRRPLPRSSARRARAPEGLGGARGAALPAAGARGSGVGRRGARADRVPERGARRLRARALRRLADVQLRLRRGRHSHAHHPRRSGGTTTSPTRRARSCSTAPSLPSRRCSRTRA
jgi:hypothetical protein